MFVKEAAMLLQNQAKAVYCHGFASHKQAFATSASDHTNIVEFAHTRACYSKVATISFTELQVRLGCHSWASTIQGAAKNTVLFSSRTRKFGEH